MVSQVIRRIARWLSGSSDGHRTPIVKRGLRRSGFHELEDRTCPDVTWTGLAGDHLASNALNWDDDVTHLVRTPVAGEKITFDDTGLGDAIIDLDFGGALSEINISGFEGKVSFNYDTSTERLTLLAPDAILGGAKTLTVEEFLTWGAGTIGDGAAGKLILLPGTSNIVGITLSGFSAIIDGWTIENRGSISWNSTGGTLSLTDHARLQNSETAEFIIPGPFNTSNFTIQALYVEDQEIVSFVNYGTFNDESTGQFTIDLVDMVS